MKKHILQENYKRYFGKQSLNEDLSSEMGPDILNNKLFNIIKKYVGKKFSVVYENDKTSIYIYYEKGVKKVVDPVQVGGAIIITAINPSDVEVYGDDAHSMNVDSKKFNANDESKITSHIKKLSFKLWR